MTFSSLTSNKREAVFPSPTQTVVLPSFAFKEMSQERLRMLHNCTGSTLVKVPLAVGQKGRGLGSGGLTAVVQEY